MKTIKFLLSTFVFLLLATCALYGQSSTNAYSEAQKEEFAANMEEFFLALDRSEEQKPQFREISQRYAEEMKAVRDGGGGKLQKLNKLKAIRKNKNAEMKDLLSEEQYQVYLEKQEENQKKMKENRKK